jgi:hypothetical protein
MNEDDRRIAEHEEPKKQSRDPDCNYTYSKENEPHETAKTQHLSTTFHISLHHS